MFQLNPLWTTALRTSVVLTVWFCLFVSSSEVVAERLPAPSAEDQKSQRAMLQELLKAELRPTASPQDKSTILQLKKVGESVADEPAAHYVVLMTLREFALAAGDPEQVSEATTALFKRFEVDVAQFAAADVRSLTKTAADERQLGKVVTYMATCYSDFNLRASEIAILLDGVEARRKAFQVTIPSGQLIGAIATLRAKLSQPPPATAVKEINSDAYVDTPAGNRKAGLYAFAYGQSLESALLFFAKSGDPLLIQIALAERDMVNAAEGRIALGDLWWQFAVAETNDPRVGHAAKRRSAVHYQAGRDSLTGIPKVRVQQRLEEVAKLPPPPPAVDVSGLDDARRSGAKVKGSTIFVLDRTGSMVGLKSTQAESAMLARVDALKPQQGFGVICFAGDKMSEVFAEGPRLATDEAKSYLKQSLERLEIGGGGSPWAALRVAANYQPALIVVFTDGDVSEMIASQELRNILRDSIATEVVAIGDSPEAKAIEAFFASLGGRSGTEVTVTPKPAETPNKKAARLDKTSDPYAAWEQLKLLKMRVAEPAEIAAAGLDESTVALRYANVLFERGWFREAAACLTESLRTSEFNEAVRLQHQQLLDRAFTAHLSARTAFGNAALIQEAVTAYETNPYRLEDAAKLDRYRKTAEVAKRRGEPPELTTTGKYVDRDQTWKENGVGYHVSDVLQLGNCANGRGGEWKKVTITVEPGVVISGGTLRMSDGSLKLLGTADRPVILRGVTIECDYTASVTATHVLFDNCTLKKGGNWFWKGGYSSKWDFTDCLLINTNFAGLSQRDYGLKLRRTAFAHCTFPARPLNDDPNKDGAAVYRSAWNTIEECSIFESVLTPSFVWGLVRGNIQGCQVIGDAAFASSKALDVSYGGQAAASHFTKWLIAATTNTGAGKVTYRGSPLSTAKPSPLWRLASPATDRVPFHGDRVDNAGPPAKSPPAKSPPAKPIEAAVRKKKENGVIDGKLVDLAQIVRSIPAELRPAAGERFDLTGISKANDWVETNCKNLKFEGTLYLQNNQMAERDDQGKFYTFGHFGFLFEVDAVPYYATASAQISDPAMVEAVLKMERDQSATVKCTIKACNLNEASRGPYHLSLKVADFVFAPGPVVPGMTQKGVQTRIIVGPGG